MRIIKFILLLKCLVFLYFTVMYCMSANFIFWNSTMTKRLALVSCEQLQEHTFLHTFTFTMKLYRVNGNAIGMT